MSLINVVRRSMERIAPLRLAEKWDNVGLLLESPVTRPNANGVLLTIDLTPAVLSEALSTPTSVIVAYHPTLFSATKSFTLEKPLQASLLRCAAAGISVYSPHTSLDSVWGGINDWLAKGFGRGSVSLLGTADPENLGGLGRVHHLDEQVTMETLVGRIKTHLNLEQVQVAYPEGKDKRSVVQSIGICAGSGGSVLNGIDSDVYFTGEMSHHEVLAAVAAGKHVVLCGHTNTERGFLPELRTKLINTFKEEGAASVLGSEPEVYVSQADKHPLEFA